MTDETEKLRTTLDELQAELSTIEQDDPEVRELLRTALSDIQQKLAGHPPEDALTSEDGQSISERLGGAASHYEDSHPNLSGILGGLIDALSRMGI